MVGSGSSGHSGDVTLATPLPPTPPSPSPPSPLPPMWALLCSFPSKTMTLCFQALLLKRKTISELEGHLDSVLIELHAAQLLNSVGRLWACFIPLSLSFCICKMGVLTAFHSLLSVFVPFFGLSRLLSILIFLESGFPTPRYPHICWRFSGLNTSLSHSFLKSLPSLMTTCELSFGACAPVFELLCFLCFPPSHCHQYSTTPLPHHLTHIFLSEPKLFFPPEMPPFSNCCPPEFKIFFGLQGPGEMIFLSRNFLCFCPLCGSVAFLNTYW